MEKFIRVIKLDGSVRAINLENCVLWEFSKIRGEEVLTTYFNGSSVFTFRRADYSDLAWGKLRSDLERRTNRPWDKDRPEEKITDFTHLA